MWYNLISDEQRQNTEFIYNLSYGKDSMAGLHVTIDILGIPVRRIVHAEVWATDTIPADLPPMVEFKAKADAYIKERWGLTVEHIYAIKRGGPGPLIVPFTSGMSEVSTLASSEGSLCSEAPGARTGLNGAFLTCQEKLTYEKLFYHIPERKLENEEYAGLFYGFPYTKGGWCKRLKYGSEIRLGDFQVAPGNEGPREISCIS